MYGITIHQLGKDKVSSPRNPVLLSICEYLTIPGSGEAVVESLATGIPKIASELAEAKMLPAQYIDMQIRFTAILRAKIYINPVGNSSVNTSVLRRGSNIAIVYDALDHKNTVTDIAEYTHLTPNSVRKALEALRDRHGLIRQEGGQGRNTLYYKNNV